ncbi:MAG: multicopper oxidase domain-containing protein, partial [Planctomycetota bacterium]
TYVTLTAVCLAFSLALGDGGEGEFPFPANQGAFEGGPTGTFPDAGINNVVQEDDQVGNDFPTDGLPSPLFGAQSFTQQMLRFEEFGTEPLPSTYAGGSPFPLPAGTEFGPSGAMLDAFLAAEMSQEPTRLSNDSDENPWKSTIEDFLGRALDSPPAEGRPPGEEWAHQRWSEFPPQVYYKTVQAGARTNGGVRDSLQLHGYSTGEFGPGGLYHNTLGVSGFDGTTSGIPIRFHPNMPIQDANALWTFDGTFPPKLLMARYGKAILMRHFNGLPIDPSANFGFGLHTLTTHEHNGHTPAESDGFTQAFFFPGQFYDYRWPMIIAGHDTINTSASDPRAGSPDGSGGITNLRGDWREIMSTHWFHDHMLDFTAPNVYKGNAAMMNYYSSVDRGNEAIDDGVNLRFPSGTALDWGNRDYDVNLMIADKAWDQDGQLWFNIFALDGFIGDHLFTNWLYHPYLDVRARRYRFRILNGSVSRNFRIALVDQNNNRVPFHMIANDGNIMEHAVIFDGTLGTQNAILPTIGIAERYDIIIDFSAFQPGKRLYFVNVLEADGGRGPKEAIPLGEVLSGEYDDDPCVGKFLEFRVKQYSGTDLSLNPADFVRGQQKMTILPRATEEELANALHRTFEFGRSSGTDEAPWTIKTDGGSGFRMDPRRLSAAPRLSTDPANGTLEIWLIENGGGGWSHPVHVHFEEGIVLKRGGEAPPEWEKWARKDVYRVGEMDDSEDSVEMAIRFREFSGSYMEHCHNTQHEDHAMLLRWDIENPGQVLLMPTPMPTWDGVEYVDTVALPTFRSGDGEGPDGDGGGSDQGGDDDDDDD